MGLLSRLLGKKSKPSTEQAAAGEGTGAKLIRVYDSYGREFQITKEQWRDNVLLGTLESNKDNPDALYGAIVTALNDGFAADAVPFAEHLQRTDPNKSRGAVLLGVVYLTLERLDDAERTFRTYLTQYGEEGYVLANLAKVISKRGDEAAAEKMLWRAIEIEPNQDNGVGWYVSSIRERAGEDAGIEALTKISRLRGSWRAQLWLARAALERQDKDGALRFYEEALQAAARPVPGELLMQLTGDLGNHGFLIEALKLANLHFDAEVHGLQVGNNLIKANMDLGRLDHAREILNRLYALKRPDFQQTLSYWDTEIARMRVESSNASLVPPRTMTMLTFEGPVWASSSSPAQGLFPSKEEDAVIVGVLGSSFEGHGVTKPQLQLADTHGRISRALPLFLVEQIHFTTAAKGFVLQPWMAPGGFVLSGEAWSSEMAIDQAKAVNPPADYVLLTHLTVKPEGYSISYRLCRCVDNSVMASGTAALNPEDIEPGFKELARQVLTAVMRYAKVEPIYMPEIYDVPRGRWFSDYQLRLEQMLAIRSAGMGDVAEDFLHGEREMIGGCIHLCLEHPTNATTRIILVEALRRMKAIHPQIAEEFRESVERLQTENPIGVPAGEIVSAILKQVF